MISYETIELAGSYPIRFGKGLCSTGPMNGPYRNGMAVDTIHRFGDEHMFSGGVMSRADTIRLKEHIEKWLMIEEHP